MVAQTPETENPLCRECVTSDRTSRICWQALGGIKAILTQETQQAPQVNQKHRFIFCKGVQSISTQTSDTLHFPEVALKMRHRQFGDKTI